MKNFLKRLGLAVLLSLTAATPLLADEVSAAKDLTSVIALLGLPCGKVVQVKPQGKDDNIATCSDGNVYRVYINPQGRVEAKKQ